MNTPPPGPATADEPPALHGRPLLYHIPYSPWSSQARAALAWHGVPVRLAPFVPMVSLPGLRWHARRPFGRLTVPCLILADAPDGTDRVICDSVAIARYAEARGDGAPLFPAAHAEAIQAWSDRAQAAMSAGRALTTAAVSADKAALRSSVPAPFRRPAALADALGAMGVAYLRRKYRFDAAGLESHMGTLRALLTGARRALDGRPWLFAEGPTWADLTVATALHFVAPPLDLPLDPAQRPHFGRPNLAAEFADLLAWRDAVLKAMPMG